MSNSVSNRERKVIFIKSPLYDTGMSKQFFIKTIYRVEYLKMNIMSIFRSEKKIKNLSQPFIQIQNGPPPSTLMSVDLVPK